jgi:hypothetical protein
MARVNTCALGTKADAGVALALPKPALEFDSPVDPPEDSHPHSGRESLLEARPEGLEPPTDRVETGCSIH